MFVALVAALTLGAAAPAPIAKASAAPAGDDAVARGKKVYDQSCASCHGASGQGNGADAMYYSPEPTNFTIAAFAQQPDAQVLRGIREGKGNVPAFKMKLTDAAVQDVVAYLRSLAPAAKKGPPKAKAKKAKRAH